MARPTKEELKKREEARKMLEDTFGDVFQVDNKDVVEVAEKLVTTTTTSDTKNNRWLEAQVTELNERNEELELLLGKAKEDYNKLLNSKKSTSNTLVQENEQNDDEIINGVKAIFDDLRMNYEGKNNVRTRYYKADIKILLDKFLKTFPFLIPRK